MNNWEYTYKKMRRKTACLALIYIVVAVGIFWLIWVEGILRQPLRMPFDALMGVAGIFALIKIVELLWLLKARGKYIYQLGNGLAFLENKDVKMFQEMSMNGYSLKSVNCFGFYKFEQDEPRDLSYSIDYHCIEKGEGNTEEYKEIFESSGWEYVCGDRTIHYFRAPKGTVAIYTDDSNLSDKYSALKKISMWAVVIGGIVAIVFFGIVFLFNENLSLWLVTFLGAVGGAGLGIALVMSVGVLFNHLKAKRLRNRQSI